MAASSHENTRRRGVPQQRSCPVCRRPVSAGEADDRFRPFCSKRCADVDLGRWLGEVYRIPSEDEPDEDEADGTADDPRGG